MVNRWKKRIKKFGTWTAVVLVSCTVTLLLVLLADRVTDTPKSHVAVAAIRILYTFQNPVELTDNMDDLRKITTEQVYDQLTVDRTERALSVYLKFKGEPSTAVVEKETENYIIYSINNKYINSMRRFVFFYETNKEGKISYVRESEITDFTTNN